MEGVCGGNPTATKRIPERKRSRDPELAFGRVETGDEGHEDTSLEEKYGSITVGEELAKL